MRLNQVQVIKPVPQYRTVLRNFFMMVTSVILLFSLALFLLINMSDSEKSYEAKSNVYVLSNFNE
jgi:hypothetical protein